MAKFKELIDNNGHVVIPIGTGKIAKYAFNGCANLISIDIAPDTKEVLASAFKNCSSLKQIVIPEGISDIPESTFDGCSSLSSVILPSTVKCIGINAFKGCTCLTTITIPEGISEISDNTFEGCESLTTVKLPSTIKKIGTNAFGGCKALNIINFPEGLTEIGDFSFKDCNALDIQLPNGLKYVGKEAFSSCGFHKIDIPNVDSIGESAFQNNGSLTEISWPSNLTKVPDRVFSGCKQLAEVSLPNNLVAIGNGSFSWCEKLQKISLPESLVDIADFAFYNSGIEEIDIPSNTATIGFSAFSHTMLTTILIPESVTEMGSSTFSDTPMTEATVNAKIDTLPSSIFSGCKSLEKVILPSCLKMIDGCAFYGTSISTIDIPDSVTEIGTRAFANTPISSIIIPKGVKQISSSLFENCNNLVEIKLPENLESFGFLAFENCSSLCEISFPEFITDIPNIFAGCKSLNLRLSANVKSFHKSNEWKTLTIDETNPYLAYKESCLIDKQNNSIIWMGASCKSFPDGITGIGEDKYSSWMSCDWCDIRDKQIPEVLDVEELVIPEGITYLGYLPFDKMPKLRSLTLPNSIKSIQKNFLEKCMIDTYYVSAELFINSSLSCKAKLMSFNLTGVETIDNTLFEKIKEKCDQNKNVYAFFNGTLLYPSEKKYQKRREEVYGQELAKVQKAEAARLEAEKDKMTAQIEDAAISSICAAVLKPQNIAYKYIAEKNKVEVSLIESVSLKLKIGSLETAQKSIEELAIISSTLLDNIRKFKLPIKHFEIEKKIFSTSYVKGKLYPIFYNSDKGDFRVSVWFEEDFINSDVAGAEITDFFSILDNLSEKYSETLVQLANYW